MNRLYTHGPFIDIWRLATRAYRRGARPFAS